MLRKVKDLRGYSLRASDGVIGRVEDFYFDDEDWGIRYLVVNTGSWLSGRKVLISPIAVGHAGWMAKRLPVALTRAQVEGSPDIDTRKPVSRQHEAEYFKYYGYPFVRSTRSPPRPPVGSSRVFNGVRFAGKAGNCSFSVVIRAIPRNAAEPHSARS
jgi:hypothetical protein